MREFRILRKIFIFIAIIGVVIFVSNTYYIDYQAKKHFLNEKYEGLITEIHFVDGMSNSPKFKINNQWVYFGIANTQIDFKVQIGDSIVKKQGHVKL